MLLRLKYMNLYKLNLFKSETLCSIKQPVDRYIVYFSVQSSHKKTLEHLKHSWIFGGISIFAYGASEKYFKVSVCTFHGMLNGEINLF